MKFTPTQRKRLVQLAEWLEGGAKHESIVFDMSTGMNVKTTTEFDPKKDTACTTACCIAGAAVQFFDHPKKMVRENWDNIDWLYETSDGSVYQVPWWLIRKEAVALLFGQGKERFVDGEGAMLARRLFTPDEVWDGDLSDYSDPQWAARTIRHLLATGKVDWQFTASPDAVSGSHELYLALLRQEEMEEA